MPAGSVRLDVTVGNTGGGARVGGVPFGLLLACVGGAPRAGVGLTGAVFDLTSALPPGTVAAGSGGTGLYSDTYGATYS